MPAKSHGDYGTRLYKIWSAMKQRCYNKNNDRYFYYGGKGIEVCDEWRDNYPAFKSWALTNGYTKDLTIERRNNSKGYCPENCSWISRKEQALNTSQVIRIEAFGETKLHDHWAKDPRCVVSSKTFRQRMKMGWTAEKAMSTPARN